MDSNSRAQYYPSQDSLAVEMLNKLQDASGFTTVALPEGYTLQPTLSNSSLVSGSAPTLNSSLITPSLRPAPGEGVILSSASGLDPALTQLLVAAQSGNSGVTHSSGSNLISDVQPVLASGMGVTLPSGSSHALHPVLSASLAPSSTHAPALSAPMLLPADPTPPAPPPASSAEAMTITVQCTMSDTVIVVGQQNWQCCMCRDIHGFDVSIDQHLAHKHNLHLTVPRQESGAPPNANSVSTGFVQNNGDIFADRKQVVPAQPLETISEQALASLQNSDSSNGRSGLEREVALLMAQTFTHSGDGFASTNEGTNTGGSSIATASTNSATLKKQTDIVQFAECAPASSTDINSGNKPCATEKDKESGTTDVFDKMINKVERAILSTSTSDTKNDLILVATELARMRKDVTSKRSKMKKNHRYITCPECGKEVRNRKDLIKQHNRCHEKTKRYRCLICNKMFKYIHTLRRHVSQQGHTGGLSSEMEMNSSPDVDSNETTVSETVAGQVKREIDEDSIENLVSVNFPPLLSETKPGSSESKAESGLSTGKRAYEKILALLLAKGERNRTATGKKMSLLQCFVCDREIRNRNYYITRHARCHLEDLCYTCDACGQEFYRSDYYRDHMAQHGETVAVGDTTAANAGPDSVKRKQSQKTGTGRKKVSTPKPQTVPCKICGKGIFNRTYNIKRHAQQHSILEWEIILGSSQLSSSRSKSSAGSQRPIHCGLCGMGFKSYTLKRRHMLKHRSNFFCKVCGGKFDSGAELMVHIHNCRKSSGATTGTAQDRGQQIGKENDRGPTWRKRDTKQASGVKKFTCGVCNASIIHTTQNINRHMRELHSDGQPHNCPMCSRTYDSYHKLQRHLKSHGDTGGICHICGKVFQTKSALRSHTKLHASPEGMFQCPQCPKSFRFQGRLEKHVRKHAEHADVCPHCGKVYISKIHLQRHISVVHMGIKDYRHKCNQCGAQFFESVQLRDHIAYRHQGIQMYTCKYCHKGFNCRPTMVRHERKEHTNYLPYKCLHCSQCFPEKSKLVAHEMTHTGVSPHKCDICNKYFTTGSALKAHKNLHLGVKPFVCNVCGKTYLKNWHLQQHMRKAHRAVEIMVYNIANQNPQGQEVGMQNVGQPNILPATEQPCLQNTDTKFLHPPVQEQYLHMQTREGNSLQQTSDLPPTAQNVMQGQIAMQPAVVYP